MDSADRTGVRYRALAEPARRRIIDHLKETGRPCDVAALSAALGLHPNTIRGHLDLLEEAGLVTRSKSRTHRPGRPPLLFSSVEATADPETSAYRRLAEMLSFTLCETADEPAKAAETAGRVLGRRQAEATSESDGPVARLIDLLEGLGFRQEVTAIGHRLHFEVVGCPYRDLAAVNREVICSLHLGLLQGAGEVLGMRVEGLDPFLSPSLCRSVMSLDQE